MKIKKRVNGNDVILEYKIVRIYPQGFILYDVCMSEKFLYRTCLTGLDIKNIKENGYMITDEEVFS